jgi:hypothetical protein
VGDEPAAAQACDHVLAAQHQTTASLRRRAANTSPVSAVTSS